MLLDLTDVLNTRLLVQNHVPQPPFVTPTPTNPFTKENGADNALSSVGDVYDGHDGHEGHARHTRTMCEE